MGLFTYHRLGKMKSAEKDTARESELSRKVLEKQYQESQKELHLKRKEIYENNKKDIDRTRISVYDYLDKKGFKDIQISLKSNASFDVSARYEGRLDKDGFISTFKSVNNRIYLIDDYVYGKTINLYDNSHNLILTNNGDKPIFGISKVKAFLTEKRHREHIEAVKAAQRARDRKHLIRHRKTVNFRVISLIIAFFLPEFSFIYYLIKYIRMSTNDSVKSAWNHNQIKYILIGTFVWSFIFIILGM